MTGPPPADVFRAGELPRVPTLAMIMRGWGRIGCVGFGGPPAHITLLRRLCVEERGWITGAEFEDGIAATNLLPGPASTQLAIFCAWRLRGPAGAIIGGLAFIVPGLAAIIALSALFLSNHPPLAIAGAAAGMGAAVGAVAARAAAGLVPSSWLRIRHTGQRTRWLAYVAVGGVAAVLVGPWLVLAIAGCGVVEVLSRSGGGLSSGQRSTLPLAMIHGGVATGGLAGLAWVALKVGALSYGGGFVIIPLMRSDAVSHYHWMSNAQFLNAVALGQVTPGPVVQTVAVVGYAAAGVGGALLAAGIAFAPSFAFVLAGGPYFDRLRSSPAVQAFLDGAGPTAIGAIGGSTVLLAMQIHHLWQGGVLAAAAIWLLVARRGVVSLLLVAGVVGAVAALAGAPVSSGG